ncbi:MAG: hypothetical protein AAB263_08740, partial [Planctomycetota bacterium]
WPQPIGTDGPLTTSTPKLGHLRLVGMLPSHGVRMIRDFTLENGALRCGTRFERVEGSLITTPVAVWQIAQVPYPVRVLARTADAKTAIGLAERWSQATADGEQLTLTLDPIRSGEAIFSAQVLAWRGADGSGLALIRRGSGGPAKVWVGRPPKPGEDAEPASAELELTSVERALAPGEAVELVTEMRLLESGDPLPAGQP